MKYLDYVQSVLNHSLDVPQYVYLSVERFKRDYERASAEPEYPFFFDLEEVKRFESFAGKIRMKDGLRQGEPFNLQPWQSFIIASIFGWKKRSDNTLRFNNVYLSVPRKNGKTALMSLLVLYQMLAKGEYSFSGICAASTEKQARKLHDDVKGLIKYDANLSKIFHLTKDDIKIPKLDSSFTVFASEATSLDGRNDSLTIIDEAHTLTDSSLYDVLLSGLGAKKNQLLVLITTSGFNFSGFCYSHETYVKKVLRGEEENDAIFSVIYQPDPQDNLNSLATWKKVNPNFGISFDETTFSNLYLEGRSQPTKWNNFIVKRLNVWTRQEDTWLKLDYLTPHLKEINLEDYLGEKCYISLDLSTNNDLSTYSLTFPGEEGVFRQAFRTWIPSKSVEEKTRYENVNYLAWISAGAVSLSEGTVINYGDVSAAILEDCSRFDVQEISFDPYKADAIFKTLEEAEIDVPLVAQRQRLADFGPMVSLFENHLAHGLLEFENNSLVVWNFTNAIKKTSDYGAKPGKKFEADKIDLLIVSIVGFYRAHLAEHAGTYNQTPVDLDMFFS